MYGIRGNIPDSPTGLGEELHIGFEVLQQPPQNLRSQVCVEGLREGNYRTPANGARKMELAYRWSNLDVAVKCSLMQYTVLAHLRQHKIGHVQRLQFYILKGRMP